MGANPRLTLAQLAFPASDTIFYPFPLKAIVIEIVNTEFLLPDPHILFMKLEKENEETYWAH